MNVQAARCSRTRPTTAERVFALVCLLALCWGLACGLADLVMPEASGVTVYEKKGTTVDASHSDQGYVMIKQEGLDKKLKVRLTRGKYSLTYDLNSNGTYEVYPLQLGEGKYKVQVFSQVSGNRYGTVSSLSFTVALESEFAPYLCPSQYVNYTADCRTVQRANEICAGLTDDRAKYEALSQYVVSRMSYDYDLARTVQSGYLPAVDNTLMLNTGICFDFSSLMAAMLRSQGIPTQLVIGYADKQYHAWNETYIDGAWQRFDVTAEICGTTVKTYTTERYY